MHIERTGDRRRVAWRRTLGVPHHTGRLYLHPCHAAEEAREVLGQAIGEIGVGRVACFEIEDGNTGCLGPAPGMPQNGDGCEGDSPRDDGADRTRTHAPRRFRRSHVIDRRDEPVPTTRQRLHQLRVLGRVAQSAAELVNRGVEADVEFHKRPGWPNRLAQVLPRHHFAGMLQEQKRLLLQPDLDPLPEELARVKIDLEHAEPDESS